MKRLWIIIFIFTLGISFLFIVHSSSNTKLNGRLTKHNMPFQKKIYPTYYENELQTEWPFRISKNYNESNIWQWNETKHSINVKRVGIGENGVAFVPSEDVKVLMEQLLKEHNYNLLASDMISLHRTLPDSRPDECKKLSYPEKLPSTSVIIIFHNEAWSTLLRTIWSVVDRSPPELIKEIIIVDDFSSWSFLKRPLDDYVELLPVSIKLIRTSKREGLIRARLIGAREAKGNILTFLDAHMECNEGWLQPLLARIANDRSVVAVPRIDTIKDTDMSYRYNKDTGINGFHWTLIFDWMPIPERELNRTKYDKTAPIRTPTMVGCGFSIDREFFFEIGSYDEGMNIWGSENLEISLRVWQCGGSMEVIPCSRVGHLYRISTYSFNGDANKIIAQNNARLVEVWMSDLKHIYYTVNPRYKNVSVGDLTERKDLKRRLKCKSFRWYLDNIYPESIMRKEFINFGEIRSVSQNKCVDVNFAKISSPLSLVNCHGRGGNQLFGFTNDHLIVTMQELCVGVNSEVQSVISVKCSEHSAVCWRYDKLTNWLIHTSSEYCMLAKGTAVVLGKCDPDDKNFNWKIK